jgi:hypothetical protein
MDFAEPVPEGAASRYRVTTEIRQKIRIWRQHNLSAGEIAQLLTRKGSSSRSEPWSGSYRKRALPNCRAGSASRSAGRSEGPKCPPRPNGSRSVIWKDNGWNVKQPATRGKFAKSFSRAVKFFHLNALSSPILVKVHFDMLLTMLADTCYCMLAQKLRGFESCDAQKVYRHFVRGRATW